MVLIVAQALLNRVGQGVFHVGSSQSNPITFDRAVELINVALRKRYGAAGSSFRHRYFLRFMDATPVGAKHIDALRTVRGALKGAEMGVEQAALLLPEALRAALLAKKGLNGYIRRGDKALRRIEKMVSLVQTLYSRLRLRFSL